MTEIEMQFLEINPSDLISKLKEKGAKFEFDSLLRQVVFDKDEWNGYHGRVRVRDTDGKIEIAYKETKKEVEFDKEIEFEASSFETAIEFFKTIGLTQKRKEEKRRVRYKLYNLTFDIDFWPNIPPIVEIEGDEKEEILKFAESIGFNRDDAKIYNAYQLYKEVYGIDIDDSNELVFEKNDWRLKPIK